MYIVLYYTSKLAHILESAVLPPRNSPQQKIKPIILLDLDEPTRDFLLAQTIVNTQAKERKTKRMFPKLKTSAKSVQTSAEVCADYTCSLYRLQLKSPESTTYLQFYVRVLTLVSARIHFSEYT